MAFQPLNTNGQKTMANSSPVVLASDQTSIPVAATQTTTPWVTSNPTTSVVGNGAAATAQRVTLANDSTGVIATVGAVTAITNALPAGTNVIGHVITDATSTTIATQGTATNLKTQAENYQGGTAVGSANPLQVTLANTGANATPVTVSGTVVATPATDIAPATQNVTVIDSASTTVSGANNQTLVTGTPTAGSAASFTLASIETIRVEVTGTWTGTLTCESSIDSGTTWTPQGVHQGAYTTASLTANFIGGANIAGATNFRVRATAAMTGTAVVKVIESVNTQSVYIANAAPSGTVISVLNSSTATLLAAAVYTGTGEDVTNFSEMRVSVFANVASASDGISLQQSTDNTNWDITDVYTIAAATAKTIVVPRQARYFRVVYTNGGTNQASFRLQTILNRTATAPSSQRASDGYTNETDLVQNQVFPMGYNGTTWDRIRTVGTGVLKTDTSSLAGTVTSVNNGTTDAGTQRVTLSSDSTGQVKLATGANTIGALTANQSTNVAQLAGTTTDTNSGNKSAGTLRTVIATDQPNLTVPLNVALAANQSVNVAQINGVTPLMGNGTTGTGSQRVTIVSDNTANTNPWLVTQTPATSGGLTPATGSIGNTATSIKGTAGQVFGWYFYNPNATVAYVQFFNTASGSVTVGTTAPVYSVGVPATSGANVFSENGVAHGTAITIAITTTRAGSTSPGSTVDYNVFYK